MMDENPKLQRVLRNTPFGVFLGAELTTLFFLCMDLFGTPENGVGVYVYAFTTAAAMLSAAFALYGVFTSLENQNRIAENQNKIVADNHRRKLNATKAFLPQALSKFTSVCEAGLKGSVELEKSLTSSERNRVIRDTKKQIALSYDVVETFQLIIEHTDDISVENRLSGILREHQILAARWDHLFDEDSLTLGDGAKHRTASWAYLAALASTVFRYARNEAQEITALVTESMIAAEIETASGNLDVGQTHASEIGRYARTFRRQFC